MITLEEAQELLGSPARGTQDEDLGTVDAVYLDDQTDKPEFATLSIPDRRPAVVPLVNAEFEDGILRVGYDREQVESAPDVRVEESISQSDEASLYSHYGVDYTVAATDQDTVRLHRRSDQQDAFGTIDERHDVWVEREPTSGER